MGDIFGFVGTMLEPIRDGLYTYIRRQLGYLVHCKRNIKDFADKVDTLILEKRRIQIEIETASNNAEVIHDDVREWLSKVQSMEDDKTRLLEGKQNLKCVDVRSRYRLGKEGKEKKTRVTELIEKANNFCTVGHRPPFTRTWRRTHTINYESFESRKLVFNEIMEALKDDANYKIGIHGMPGVGKTRMMEEVAEQAEKEKGSHFDEIVKIVVAQNPNLKDIQQNLAARLNLKLDIDTEDERKELLRNRLKNNGKKILVLVDDVWNDQIKLEDIGIPAAGDHTKGCKIILTSRRQDVCEKMGVPEKENFQIGVLSEAEAWSLFEKKVGDSFQTHEMHSVAEAVCRECAGLPLAILAVGGALKKKNKQVWKNALKQLKNSMINNDREIQKTLYSRIELSYNYLEDDAKKIFLLCCLFEEDAEISIDNLACCGVGLRLLTGVDTMEDARNSAHAVVDTLKTSSLLLEGTEQDFVKMHDVIRDVAISIASKNEDAMYLVKASVQKWPEEDEYKGRRAISLRFNKNYVLPDNLDCPELRILMLEGRYIEVPSSFFDGMVKLELLHLRNIWILTLPSSLKNLRMLRLYNCVLENVAFLKELKKLEILCIEDFDLQELAPEIQQLTRLQLLDLRKCDNLKFLPSGVISSLSRLEELYIPDEFDQWEVEDNASLNELNSLKGLINLEVHVPNVELLHLNELLFQSLIRFKISIGSKFSYYEIHSSATRILKLVGFSLKRELNILMEKAEVVYLFELQGLKDVFHDREGEGEGEGFLDLKCLEVQKCDGVEHLFGKPKLISQTTRPHAYASFSQLSVLEVDRCGSSYLFSPATARGLLQLKKLTIVDCEMLKEIINDDQEVMDTVSFHGLKKMKLERLPNLRSFFYVNMKKTSTTRCSTSTLMQALFNHKVAFPALEELEIELLGSLTAIWDDQLQSPLVKEVDDSFRRLKYMKVFQCEKLVNVIPSYVLPRLLNLEKLEFSTFISVGYKVEVIDSVEKGYPTAAPTINVLPRLQEMELCDQPNLVMCIRLKRLCAYSNLTDLHLSSRDNLGNVFSPSTARYLVHLKKLLVENCEKMEEIVALERGQLGEEDVVHDDDIIVFPQLKYLKLWKLPNLKSFCCCIDRSKIQEEETVEQNISRVEALFNHKVAFPALEKLMIDSLGSLTAIWDDQLQSPLVKETDDSFRRLMYVKVFQCEKLVNVIPSDMLTRLLNLEKVEVSKCDSVLYGVEVINSVEKGYPTAAPTISVLPRPQEMELYDLPNLVMYIRLKRRCAYSNLRDLHLSNRDNLENVFSPSTARYLVHLQKLIVINCEMMEEIVAVEREQLGEEDVVHDDDIIVFPQLKHLQLWTLPNLKSFCCCTRESKKQEDEIVEEKNMPRVEALFNHKVAFPALEKLKIELLGSLTTIWDDQLKSPLVKEAEDSFRRLMYMKVFQCEKLMNVIPSYMLPKLMNLEKLEVSKCDLVPNLVMYTRLNRLGACSNLTDLHLSNRDSLGNVFSPSTARYLVHLQKLTVKNCEMMEEIVAVEREQLGEEDVVHDDDIIVFPQLKHLQLRTLPNLKSFCCCTRESKKQEDEIVEQKNMPKVEALFNHKVAFPALEKLEIELLGSLTMIWDDQLQSPLVKDAEDSFQRLMYMKVFQCKKLVNVIPSDMLPKLLNLEKLEVSECDSVLYEVEVIDSVEKGYPTAAPTINVLPHLQKMELCDLPNLVMFIRLKRLCAYSNLTDLHLSNRESLGNVFSPSTARYLVHLQKLTVENCEMMEEIVAVEREQLGEEDVVHDDDIIVFPQLKHLQLRKLPNLKSFCCCIDRSKIQEEETVEENISRVEALFNHKVRFPALEELKIYDLKSLTTTWDNKLFLSSKCEDSFGQLRKINVQQCHKLVNVVPLNALGLEILEVKRCDSVVCGVEMVAPEEDGDEILVFYQLKTMTLEFLPNFKSFCWSRNNILLQQPTLFNHKVAFPALEELEIELLGSLTAIWDDQLQSPLVKEVDDSFRRLKYMKVFQCEKLVNVIPSYVLPRLLNLEKLEFSKFISVWYKVEVIDSVEKGYPTAASTINVLPRLQEMELCDQPNLVMCIRLKRLCAYSNLTDLHLSSRDNLGNVFSPSTARYLVHLKKLLVENCEKMEEIVALERGQLGEEDVVHDDDIIVFPQLKYLKLWKLPNLKSFCCCIDRSKIQEEETVEQNISRVEALFNHKVAFPALEKLMIDSLGSLTAIWDDQLQSPLVKETDDSFRRLMYVKVFQCEKLVNVIPSDMLTRLLNLEKVEVSKCDSVLYGVEVINSVEKGYPTAAPTISVLPRPQEMELYDLPNLVMYIRLKRRCAYSNLTDLHLSNRDNLENVFSPSTARYLVHLQKLIVKNCEMMEEIVAVEREQLGEEDAVHDDDIIVFPQLKHLQLWTLPNLKSFCCCTRESKKQEDEIVEEKNMPRVEALFNHKGDSEVRTEDVLLRMLTTNGRALSNLEGTHDRLEALLNPEDWVAFPALEKLKIVLLGSLTTIWDDQLKSPLVKEAEDSFRRLMYMKVFQCEKLMNVIPSYMLPKLMNLEKLEVSECDLVPNLVMYTRLNRLGACSNLTDLHLSNRDSLGNVFSPSTARYLVHLQKLTVKNCEMMEEIVAVEREQLGEEDVVHDDDIIVFPQLKHLQLRTLPNLKSFCCCTRESKKQEDEIVEQKNMPKVEALFNHKVMFPALKELEIKELKSLTAIWGNQLLLESGAQDSSFRQLKLVNIKSCEKLVIPPNAIPMLQILESLEIVSCDSLISGVEVAAIGSDEILMFSQLKKLILKELPKLNSFCSSRRGGEERVAEESNIGQPQALFNHKVEFPMLEELVFDGIFEDIWLGHLGTGSFSKVRVIEMKKYSNIVNDCWQLLQWFEVVEEVKLESCYSLEVIFNLEGVDDAIQKKAIMVMSSQLQILTLADLPKLNHIWITDSGGLLMFHNLTRLRVEKCSSLKYLFSLSIARRLTQLTDLLIIDCDAMEEIVVKNEEHGEEDSTDEIVFSKLKFMYLTNLAKLTSFCGASNAAFKLPSLMSVRMWSCPELQTFASGGIITPYGNLEVNCYPVSDLNKYVQQQYVGKGKGLQTVDNDDEGTSS